MATFFSIHTISSLILLLQLLSLTTAAAGAGALGGVCAQTRQPSRCIQLLSSSDSRSPTAALPVLGEIAIAADTDAAGAFKIKIHNLMLSARDPKLKALYRNCENLYQNGLDQLFSASENLQRRAYGKVIAASRVVAGGVSGCTPVVANNPELKGENGDTALLAAAIAIIAKQLSK